MTGCVENPRAIHVNRNAMVVRIPTNFLQHIHGINSAAGHVVRVFDFDEAGGRAMRALESQRVADTIPSQDAALDIHGADQAAGEPGRHRKLPIQNVGARFANYFLAMFGVDLDADDIAHGTGGHIETGLLAENLGRALLQPIDRGIFAVHIVADFGFGHGAAHSGRGASDGVTA
jgi:hypothetical protein